MAELSDLTAQCIRCGFCLESCPTFVITGMETESPRGRIYLARSMEEGVLPWADENRAPLDTCVGCRACETACPSGVKYGEILEMTRARFLERAPARKDFWRRFLLRSMTNPAMFRLIVGIGSLLPGRRVPGWMSRAISGTLPEAVLPSQSQPHDWPELDDSALPPVKDEVALLEGCAMGVLYSDVHTATERLLRRVGLRTVRVKRCCGALHAHNGYLNDAGRMAKSILEQVTEGTTLVTNSAGCGCWLKEAKSSAVTVVDVAEILFERGLTEVLRRAPGLSGKDTIKDKGSKSSEIVATYHEACHLAHGQNVRTPPLALLEAVPGLRLVPLPESDMCCGSGGVYNLLQPGHARKMLDRKWTNLAETGADVVVTGNPGCHAWIAQAATENGGNVQVLHTATLLEMACSGSFL